LNIAAGGSHAGQVASRKFAPRFLAGAGAFALAAGVGPVRAMGPGDKFDLVIKGAEVLDPSQSLRGRRDIGIRYGSIEAVGRPYNSPFAVR
jgi:hypothetical protein